MKSRDPLQHVVRRNAPRLLCVVMHDVSPVTWPQCEKLLAALSEVAPHPVTLLVIPEYYRGRPARVDREFCRTLTLRLHAGDELALHGFRHHDDEPVHGVADRLVRTVYTAAEGEFSNISQAQAYARILTGVRWFKEQNWPLHGFVAPAWLMSPGTWSALENLPLRYTTTLARLHLLHQGRSYPSTSLTFSVRTPLRRATSHGWVELARRLGHDAPLVRLGIHPADGAYPAVVRHWQSLLEHFLITHSPVTKIEACERLFSRGATDPHEITQKNKVSRELISR